MGSQFGRPSAGVYQLFRITDFDGGLNTADSPNSIEDNELQLMENLVVTEKGVLKKRKGLRRMNPQELQADVTTDFGNADFSFNSKTRGNVTQEST